MLNATVIDWSEVPKGGLGDLGEAIRLDPGCSDAYNGRAWIWATCPDAKYRDGRRAVESAARACELSEWKDAETIDTLAAAYAETSDFGNAVKYAEQVMPLAPAEWKPKAEARLAAYKAGKPWREP